MPISAITADVASAAVPTPITSVIVHTAAEGGGGGGGVGTGAVPPPPLAHAIAQLVESGAEAHFMMHWPHGAFGPISAITADTLSAAVPTPITSAIVHTAAVASFGRNTRKRDSARVALNDVPMALIWVITRSVQQCTTDGDNPSRLATFVCFPVKFKINYAVVEWHSAILGTEARCASATPAEAPRLVPASIAPAAAPSW